MLPYFDLSKLPGAEHGPALHIHASLYKMNFFSNSIEAGIELLKRSDEWLAKSDRPAETRKLTHWKAMALRDGAITINNFYEEILAVDNNLKDCPHLRGLIDIEAKRLVKGLFESYFPSCADIRHGVAHLAEFYSTPRQLATHSKGWINAMIDHSYHTSVNGKAVSYDLTTPTLQKLRVVEARMWDIFTPIISEASNNKFGDPEQVKLSINYDDLAGRNFSAYNSSPLQVGKCIINRMRKHLARRG